LRTKYGEPLSETFIVRPGIGVTVTYAPTGQIAEMLISPQMTDLIKSKNKTLSHDILTVIIDELVPRSRRGKFLIAAFENIQCLPQNDCVGTSERYEKLVIYYNTGTDCGVNYAVVQWKQWVDGTGRDRD
jgi:hypothetical protein